MKWIIFAGEITQVKRKWDIFFLNAKEIEKDWKWYIKKQISKPILDHHTVVYNEKNIFMGDGLSIKSAVLNADEGPIYIGNNVTIEEGAVLRGPLAICDNVRVQAHATLYGGSTIGPCSNIGGEVYNSVIFGYSDKKQQGFMGNSVVGEWCAIAAGVNVSNTQHNTVPITVWDFVKEEYEETDLPSCGFFMGDYSQLDANVTLETGTVIGIAANVTAGKLCEKHIPSFIYIDTDGRIITYSLEKTIERISSIMPSKKRFLQKKIKIFCAIYSKRLLSIGLKL